MQTMSIGLHWRYDTKSTILFRTLWALKQIPETRPFPANMTVLGQCWLVLVLFRQYRAVLTGHIQQWASAGFIAAKLYGINGTDPEPSQFWNGIGKPLWQHGTPPVLGQCRVDCGKPLRQDGTQPVLLQCRADCGKPLQQDGTDPKLGQCRPDNGKP